MEITKQMMEKNDEYMNPPVISINDALAFVKPEKRKFSINAVVTSVS